MLNLPLNKQKRKKERKRKKVPAKNPLLVKKNLQANLKRKKEEKKKKKPEEEAKSEKTESSKVDNDSDKSTAKKDRFNSAAYADELFNLTGELQASNKELARATRYFYDNEPKKQTVAIESKPFFTTEDFEKESRMNPDNLYVQRQLAMHYQANGDHSSAKEIYLREVGKNPYNPDAHFFWVLFMLILANIKRQNMPSKKLSTLIQTTKQPLMPCPCLLQLKSKNN